MRALFRSRRLLRSLMAAFLPYIVATLVLDALHVHPIGIEHGKFCRHHLTEQPAPVRTSTGYDCPSCNWLRNLPTQASRTWSATPVRTALLVAAPPETLDLGDHHLQPAWFRGPPAARA